MFGLRVIRHRIFECDGFKVTQPTDPKHSYYVSGAGHGGDGYSYIIKDWQKGIGCDWINDKHTLAQIVPPKYSEYIGKEMMK